VRSAGDTDYTFVKMTFEARALKLPACPTPEKLAELGLEPAAPAPARGKQPLLTSGIVRAGGTSGGAAQQQQLQGGGGGGVPDEGAPRIKTLGDSQLAAAIAELTGGLDPPPRPEMLPNRRRLAQDDGDWAAQHQNAPVIQIPQHPWYPRPSMLVASASGAAAAADPFAKFISRGAGAAGAVSVVAPEQTQWDPPRKDNGQPSITLTFFFGMTADKTFAYGKGNSVMVPADGVKFNIEAANWWAGRGGALRQGAAVRWRGAGATRGGGSAA
jgi:hypothetical protein